VRSNSDKSDSYSFALVQ